MQSERKQHYAQRYALGPNPDASEENQRNPGQTKDAVVPGKWHRLRLPDEIVTCAPAAFRVADQYAAIDKKLNISECSVGGRLG